MSILDKKEALSLGFLAILAFAFLRADAQTSPLGFITWQTNTSRPADYMGKALPTAASPVFASFTLLLNSQPVNLSTYTVYWYLNNSFLKGGRGLVQVAFTAPGEPSSDLRVELPDYGDGRFLKNISLPVVDPEAVIEAPFPQGTAIKSPAFIFGRPFFFNAPPEGLSFSWKVNGEEVSADQNGQRIALPRTNTGFANVELAIQNPEALLELAGKRMQIYFK